MEVEERKNFLRPLFVGKEISIGPTDGIETFAGSGVFPGEVFPSEIRNLQIGKGGPTRARKVLVQELIRKGTFREVFESFGKDRDRWRESQVVQFYREQRNTLQTNSHGAFFELEDGYVANVYINDRFTRGVWIWEFSLDSIWKDEFLYQFVFLQQ